MKDNKGRTDLTMNSYKEGLNLVDQKVGMESHCK